MNRIPEELTDTAARVLTDVIHRTMPTAAVASGLASAVDCTTQVNAVADRIVLIDAVDAWKAANGIDLGCFSGLKAYCADHDMPSGDAFVKLLRIELLKRGMRAALVTQ
jgi:hypothetical protein